QHQQPEHARGERGAEDVASRSVRRGLLAGTGGRHRTRLRRPSRGHGARRRARRTSATRSRPADLADIGPDWARRPDCPVPGRPTTTTREIGMTTTTSPSTGRSGATWPTRADANPGPLEDATLEQIDAWWRAANYLSVGQIYLLNNPLLRTTLRKEDVKPRLLGHWGTTPGLNFLYAHMNRAIAERELNAFYLTGPGHGGPGLVANTYLEGTYSETYPEITQDEEGMRRLFRQFSFPGGIPSHVAPET